MACYGAIIGDISGSIYEFNNHRSKNFDVMGEDTFFTDDTVLTVAVMDILSKGCQNDPLAVSDIMREYCKKYPASYGCSFACWIHSQGVRPYNSFGNGAAMRVSPVGLMAKTEQQVKEWSEAVTKVTHNHPEGLKGAEVTAMCVFYAKNGKSKEFIKEYASKYYNIDFDYEELRRNYFFNETCQSTVPQAIWCFLNSESLLDCIKTSISIGGDSDTLAAISCAIAEAYYGEDASLIKKAKAKMTKHLKQTVKNFAKMC